MPFLAKSDYFTVSGQWRYPPRLFVGSQAIPVDRHSSCAAQESLELALEVLREGRAFGITPRGNTLARDGRIFTADAPAWLVCPDPPGSPSSRSGSSAPTRCNPSGAKLRRWPGPSPRDPHLPGRGMPRCPLAAPAASSPTRSCWPSPPLRSGAGRRLQRVAAGSDPAIGVRRGLPDPAIPVRAAPGGCRGHGIRWRGKKARWDLIDDSADCRASVPKARNGLPSPPAGRSPGRRATLRRPARRQARRSATASVASTSPRGSSVGPADQRRDQSAICVVEEPWATSGLIERTREFRGTYHVLGAISPIDGHWSGRSALTELMTRLASGEVTEVIIATDPNLEGEATAAYLSRFPQGMDPR